MLKCHCHALLYEFTFCQVKTLSDVALHNPQKNSTDFKIQWYGIQSLKTAMNLVDYLNMQTDTFLHLIIWRN